PILCQHLLHLRTPKPEGAMLFEGRHMAKHDALLQEKGHSPFHGLRRSRTRLMHEFPQVRQHALRKRRILFDVRIHSRIHVSLVHEPSLASKDYTSGNARAGPQPANKIVAPSRCGKSFISIWTFYASVEQRDDLQLAGVNS